uniref:NADH-quinone oxidoreductase subunit C n=1 Tax=Ignisphaera aggregans TaxID=334771 RepID=A0A7C5UZ12_9CREN
MSKIREIEDILANYIVKKDVVKPNRPVFYIDANNVRDVIALLKQHLGDEAIYISNIIGVDKVSDGVIEVNYFIHLIPFSNTIVIKTSISRDNPKIPSIIDLLPGAYSGECETYDLLGVEFMGNKYLRRSFFVPTDVASKNIFPLRKDAKV